MVEIFKTNVSNHLVAQQLVEVVNTIYRAAEVSFDLEDCDHIFRFYADEDISKIIEFIGELFKSFGFSALALNDELPYAKLQNPCLTTNKLGIDMALRFI